MDIGQVYRNPTMWKSIFDSVGMHVPLLLGIYVVFQLFYFKIKLYALIALVVGTYYINVGLKRWIKDPRPNPMVYFGNPNQYYGMPSGHAQMFTVVATWYWLTQKTHLFVEWGPIVALFIITFLERWINNKHTHKQLVVGAILGTLTAYGMYVFMKNVGYTF